MSASHEYRVQYLPAESDTGMFGGNSNWRGPIWMPMNVLLIRALLQFYMYYGNAFTVECPTGSGNRMNLFEVAREIGARLTRGMTVGSRRFWLVCAMLGGLLPGSGVLAQQRATTPAAVQSQPTPAADALGRDTPRGTLLGIHERRQGGPQRTGAAVSQHQGGRPGRPSSWLTSSLSSSTAASLRASPS